MDKVVRIVNETGNPQDTQVIVDGKPLSLSNMMSVSVSISPDKLVTASVELKVDELDILANVDVKE